MDNKDNIEYGQRLRMGREELSLSQEDFGKLIGKHYNTIKNWESGSTKPNEYHEKLIEEKTGIRIDWLKTGKGRKFSNNKTIGNLREQISTYRSNANHDPEIRIWGYIGAGDPFDIHMQETNPNEMKPMETMKVSGLLDRKVKDCFRVNGDSMYRLIPHNSLVGVDFEDKKKIVAGEIYALNLPAEGLVVKEIHPEGRRLKIHSHNERIQDYYLEEGEWEEYVIAGRIAWILQDTNKI